MGFFLAYLKMFSFNKWLTIVMKPNGVSMYRDTANYLILTSIQGSASLSSSTLDKEFIPGNERTGKLERCHTHTCLFLSYREHHMGPLGSGAEERLPWVSTISPSCSPTRKPQIKTSYTICGRVNKGRAVAKVKIHSVHSALYPSLIRPNRIEWCHKLQMKWKQMLKRD